MHRLQPNTNSVACYSIPCMPLIHAHQPTIAPIPRESSLQSLSPPRPHSCTSLLQLLDKRLDALRRRRRAAGLGDQHAALLVHDEDAALRALGLFLEADGRDERRRRVAQQRVRQLLLLAEGRVGFGRVAAETVDGEPVGCEGLVGVAEEADLVGAWMWLVQRYMCVGKWLCGR